MEGVRVNNRVLCSRRAEGTTNYVSRRAVDIVINYDHELRFHANHVARKKRDCRCYVEDDTRVGSLNLNCALSTSVGCNYVHFVHISAKCEGFLIDYYARKIKRCEVVGTCVTGILQCVKCAALDGLKTSVQK